MLPFFEFCVEVKQDFRERLTIYYVVFTIFHLSKAPQRAVVFHEEYVVGCDLELAHEQRGQVEGQVALDHDLLVALLGLVDGRARRELPSEHLRGVFYLQVRNSLQTSHNRHVLPFLSLYLGNGHFRDIDSGFLQCSCSSTLLFLFFLLSLPMKVKSLQQSTIIDLHLHLQSRPKKLCPIVHSEHQD